MWVLKVLDYELDYVCDRTIKRTTCPAVPLPSALCGVMRQSSQLVLQGHSDFLCLQLCDVIKLTYLSMYTTGSLDPVHCQFA